MEFDETHKKALTSAEAMINRLENDREYYDADIEWEYTPFKDSCRQLLY